MDITDEMIAHAEVVANTNVVEILKGLSPERQAKLLDTVGKITAGAAQKWGVAISATEAATLSHAKSATLSDLDLDLDGALGELANKSAKVAHAIAGAGGEKEPDHDLAALDAMNPAQRINWARKAGVGDGKRARRRG